MASAVQPGPRPRRWRRLMFLLTLMVAAVLAYTGVTYLRIRNQSFQDETRPADVIVVFGAAAYVGRPSPVYRARLDHAFELYQRGVAPMIITTGGAGGDPKFSEGQVGRDYLVGRGIPEPQLIAETQSDKTVESARRVGVIMRANGMRSAVAVSDGYHIFRIKKMLENEGVTVYGAPRPTGRPLPRSRRVTTTLREVLSYTLWSLGIT